MDTISQILKSLHFAANIYLHSEFCSPWSAESDNPGMSSFHVIAYGNCSLRIPGRDEIQLNAGDLIFFPRNISHEIANPRNDAEISTTLICGRLDFQKANHPILTALPDVIHIQAHAMTAYPWLQSLFQHIVNEAESGIEGRQMILDRLSEILFIYIVRYYLLAMAETAEQTSGLLAGLNHPQICKSLQAIHLDLGKPWTVASLAELAGMSRAAFADKFNQLIGQTPLQYLTLWRMQSAHQALSMTDQSILEIALDHGYQSEAAFNKAFKKMFAMTPGKSRKHERS
ncbi:AraC family transcriptional regulator [Marinicella sp. W31]|uniref:AraC family transcriptional regulator n=1 Tax=Marinicella sp. W31 TaxID=3023713 RepID=UPI003757F257